MPLPNETELIDGLLRAMHQIGRPASIDEQEAQVKRLLDIRQSDAAEIQEGTRTKLNYRLAWSRTYLKGLDLLQQVGRGVWALTERGKQYGSFADFQTAGADDPESLFGPTSGLDGLDNSTPDEFGAYPIDSVLIRQETRTLFEIVRRIRDGRFIMDPDFQRAFIWSTEKQSKLVESIIMRIPLPVFYLAEREDGRTVVVDGLQRLTTFLRYLDGALVLKELRLATELNGSTFSQLPTKLQNRIEDTQLILYLIDSKVPEQAKLDIFDRVNGGVPLTRQQMRNSIYCGSATRWLKKEVETIEFQRATGGSLDSLTMRDRECANRFCAFTLLGPSDYIRGDMDAFLAAALKQMNRTSDETLDTLSTAFRRSLNNNYQIFRDHSFRKHRSASSRRTVINVALFDVLSVLLAKVSEEKAASNAEDIRHAFYLLMDDTRFVDAISFGTNSTTKVRARFSIALGYLTPFFDVHDT
jgi:hypothetical protein